MSTVAEAENVLGHVELAAGNVDEARILFARCAQRFGALGVPWGVGNALAGGARVALSTGDAGEAERLLDQAASTLRQASPWFMLLTFYVRSILAVRSGEADRALAFARNSLMCIRELHDRFAFVYALVPLAAAAVLRGDDEWAARILGARAAISERAGATVLDESVQDLQERAEHEVRARLGPDRYAAACVAGRGTSIDSLIEEIDRVLAGRPLT